MSQASRRTRSRSTGLRALLATALTLLSLVASGRATAAGVSSTPWTVPTMPPYCSAAQAASGDVDGCLLSAGGDPPSRGWGTPPFPAAVAGEVLPWVDVAQGASGNIVREIQQALADAGHSIAVDGQFGPITASVVKAFQTAEGLPSTGVVDAATAARLGVERRSAEWPPPGWKWLGWAYNGSPALADWEARMATNAGPIGDVRAKGITLMRAALPLYEGFVREIQAGGYKVSGIGSYAFRCTSSAGKSCEGLDAGSLSNHAYGLAVDVNSWLNPEVSYSGVDGKSACATPQATDIPRWVVQIAERWGLYWGGYGWSGGCKNANDPKSRVLRDPMHFEFRGTPEQARAIFLHNTGLSMPPEDLQPAVRLGPVDT